MNTITIGLLVSVLAVLNVWGVSVSADEFTVGVEDIDYFPISAMRADHYAGYSRELLDAFAMQNNHTFIYKPYSVKSLLGAYKAGQIDFKFPDNPKWAQEFKKGLNIRYSDSALNSIDGVMVMPSSMGLESFRLKRLGTIIGFTRSAFQSDIASGEISRHEHENMEGLMKLMQKKIIDGVYSNVFVTRNFLKNSKYGTDFVVFDESLAHEKTNFSLSSIRHPETVKEFNAFLEKNSQWISKLKIQYGLQR